MTAKLLPLEKHKNMYRTSLRLHVRKPYSACGWLNDPQHDKTNKMACAPSKDSDQPGHPPSLISLRCPHEETLGPLSALEDSDQTGWIPRLI